MEGAERRELAWIYRMLDFCFEIIFGLVSGQILFKQINSTLKEKDYDLLEIKLASFV